MPRTLPRSPRGVRKASKPSTRTSAAGCSSRPTRSPATCTPSQRAVRDALVVAWHHWRKVSRLDAARGLRAPAGLDPRPASQQRPLVGAAEGPRRRDPRHARRPRQADHHPAQGAAAHPPDRAADRPHGPRGRRHPRDGRAGAADRERAVRRAPRRPVHRDPGRPRGASRPRWSRSAGRDPRSSCGPARPGAGPTPPWVSWRPSPRCSSPGSLVTDGAGVRPALATKGILEGTTTEAPRQQEEPPRRRTRSPPRRCSASTR